MQDLEKRLEKVEKLLKRIEKEQGKELDLETLTQIMKSPVFTILSPGLQTDEEKLELALRLYETGDWKLNLGTYFVTRVIIPAAEIALGKKLSDL